MIIEKKKFESNNPDIISVKHKIQKYIIDLLTYTEVARFSELRPPRTDTNVFTYHLNTLVKMKLIVKVENGYTLSMRGMSYVDRLEGSRPKIVIMLLIQNSDGDILLQKRGNQPFINTLTLPYGDIRMDEGSLVSAAQRIIKERLHLNDQSLMHAGECYIRVKTAETILSTTLVHVFSFNCDDIKTNEALVWARPHRLKDYRLAPAIEAIIARGFFRDPFFFEEFEVDWYNEPYES